MNRCKILNSTIDNISMSQCLQHLENGVLFTPNVDHLMRLQNDREFFNLYQKADFVVCDSKIIQWASRFLGDPIIEKISGSDFFPNFYTYHRDNPNITLFLLGSASESIVQSARKNINNKVGRDMVVGVYAPTFGFEENNAENEYICNLINQSGATVLAVGVGSPKQEKWIMRHKQNMPHIKIFMAIGATIDFEAGNVKRAPKWLSNFGIEWLYRLYLEPKRLWKRYLVDDIPFFWLILKQKLRMYINPWTN